jgi:hypothetical protein
LHDLLAQRQPDAAPRIFIAAMKPLKNGDNPFSILVIESDAVVFHRQPQAPSGSISAIRGGASSSGLSLVGCICPPWNGPSWVRKNSPRDPSFVVLNISTAAQKRQNMSRKLHLTTTIQKQAGERRSERRGID